MRRAAASTTLVALSAVTVAPAHAHLVETGFGAFYDGIAHVIVTPADLLVVVALALLAGQQGTRAARHAVFALPVAWLIGGLVGARWPFATALPLLTTLSFALAGALVALNARVRDVGVVAFVIIAGVLHGLMNGATMVPSGRRSIHAPQTVTPTAACVALRTPSDSRTVTIPKYSILIVARFSSCRCRIIQKNHGKSSMKKSLMDRATSVSTTTPKNQLE